MSDALTTTLANPCAGLSYEDISRRMAEDPAFKAEFEAFQQAEEHRRELERRQWDLEEAARCARHKFEQACPARHVARVLAGNLDAEAHRVVRDFMTSDGWALVLSGSAGLAKTTACVGAAHAHLHRAHERAVKLGRHRRPETSFS